MARILTAGNEFGNIAADGFYVTLGNPTASRTQTFSAETPEGNRGDYSFYLTSGTAMDYDFETEFPGGLNEVYIRMHVYHGGRTDGTWENFRLLTNTGAIMLRQATVDCSSGVSNGGRYYNAFYNSAASQFLNNSSFCYRNHIYNLNEFHIKFGGSGARVRMWSNDVLIMDWTGSLTGPSGETVFHRLSLDYRIVTGGGPSSRYYDNIAVNDTTGAINNGRIGEGYVLPFWPHDNGTTTELTNSHRTSVDNFKFINERKELVPGGFVYPTAVNQKDTYVLREPPPEFHGVNAIKVAADAVRHGTAITKLKMLVQPPAQSEIDLPSGVGVGLDIPVGGDGYVSAEFSHNTNTGQPFTLAELNGMETGIQFIA